MVMMTVDPASLRIVVYPDSALREKSKPVDPEDETVREVARRMLELMHDADGVGLAAEQVALPWRLFVTHGRDVDPHNRVFINPTLTVNGGELVTEEEGCLSLPGIHVQVRRAPAAEISATDLDGRPFTMKAEGLLSRIWQHEYDHLHGVLIIDKMSPMDRLSTRKALKELRAASSGGGP